MALGVVPACPIEDRPARPTLLVRAASQGRVSVTLGFDGEPTALARLEARLEEVVRWAFGDLVELERGPTGEQPGLAFRLWAAERAHGWGLLRASDVEPENRRGLPTPWWSLYLAPLAAQPYGELLFVNWEGLPPLQVDLPAQDPHPALGSVVASLLAGRKPRRTDVVLLGSPDSTPAMPRDLPNLAGRVDHPAERRALRPALHWIGAVAGANLAGRGLGGEQGLLVVCEVTELDRPTLATLTRVAHLGSRTGVQIVVASARPWPLVVDHRPLGLLAMLTSRLSLGERRQPAWCLSADLDDWRFGDLSLLSVPTSSLARLDQAYAPPKPPAPGAPRPASA